MSVCGCRNLSGEVLLHVVAGDEDSALEAPTFQLQVLSLPPQQVGFLLGLQRTRGATNSTRTVRTEASKTR